MTTPAGCLSLAQEYLRQTLAACATFQTLCNLDNAAHAAERIYHEGLPEPGEGDTHTLQELQSLRPYAIVYTAEESGFTRTYEATGTRFEFDDHGRLMIRLERDSPDNANDQPTTPANLDWRNVIGEIIDDLCKLAGTPGYLACQTIGLVEFNWSQQTVAKTLGIYQEALLLVQW